MLYLKIKQIGAMKNERNNKKEQAMVFYKKILSMSGDPEDGTHVKARRALKALEE